MKCPVCNADVDGDMSFCAECGTRVRPASSAGAQTTLIPNQANEQARPPQPSPYQPDGVPAFRNDVPPMSAPQTQSYTQNPPVTPLVPPETRVVPGPSQPMPYTPPMGGPTTTYASVPNSTTAIVSLVMGILSWVFIPIIGAIAAIVAGHMARGEIKRENGRVGGAGMALAGLILGYSQLALAALAICALIALSTMSLAP